MSANPYERRQSAEQRRAREWRADGMASGPLGFGSFEAPRALAIEDLDALAFSARARGEQAATARLTNAHHDELRRARREAWEEGNAVGENDGRRAILVDIDEQYAVKVREAINDAQEILDKAGGEDPRRVSKDDLARTLDATVAMLAELVAAHHQGFQSVEELPF